MRGPGVCVCTTSGIRPWDVLAGRRPRLLLRIDGALWLRLADRAFEAVLLKLPPRLLRLAEESIRCPCPGKPRSPESHRVAMVQMCEYRARAVRKTAVVDGPALPLSLPLPQLVSCASEVLGPQPGDPAVEVETKERQPLPHWCQDRRALLGLQVVGSQPLHDLCPTFFQEVFAVAEEDEVVHVAHVASHSDLEDVAIQSAEDEIRKPLARQVADRQPLPGMAWVPDDSLHQREQLGIGHGLGERGEDDFVTEGGEERTNIHLEEPA